jgi:hypothetical protein
MESRTVLSGLTLAPALHAPGALAAEVKQAVATPLVVTRDTVEIRNNTKFTLVVHATLEVSGLPTIHHGLGPHFLPSYLSTKTFSFGRDTNDYIEIRVWHTDVEFGRPLPHVLTATLNKPSDGYNGKLFTISEIDGRFHVST